MKKNIFMRLACVVLVLTLLSTCVISGTFAKYVTTDSAADSARVAKWGVTVKAYGSLFNDSYKDTETTYDADETGDAITVQAVTEGTKVVAPGTNNADNVMTFVIDGKPEVDFNLAIAATTKDVVLPAGTYTDYTKVNEDGSYGTFTTTEAYYPVVFTLTNGTDTFSGTAAEVAKKLTDLSNDYDANTDLKTIYGDATAETYTLTWAWDFDDNGAGTYDEEDTFLGNVAAGLIAAPEGVVTEIGFDLSITATQID